MIQISPLRTYHLKEALDIEYSILCEKLILMTSTHTKNRLGSFDKNRASCQHLPKPCGDVMYYKD